MRTTLRQVLEIHEGLKELAEREMAPVSSYRVARALAAVRPEWGVWQKERERLIRVHGTPTGQGSAVVIEPNTPAMEAFLADEAALLEEELEVEIPRIRVSDLVAMEPKWVALMLPIVDE